MPTLEWIGSFQNLPHQFTSTAAETLQLAKQRQMFNGEDLGPMWTILVEGGGNRLPTPPIERNPTTGRYEYLAPAYWTIDNVKIADKTLNEIFNAAPPPDPGPGVADIWQGPADAIQVYVPPLQRDDVHRQFSDVVTTTGGGINAAPTYIATATPTPFPEAQPHMAPQPTFTPGPITVVMPGGAYRTLTTLEDLGAAIEAGAAVLRDDGSAAVIQRFMGGVLVDGNPLNVILGLGWIDGQWDALQQGLQTGEVTMEPTAAPPTAFPWYWIAAAAAAAFVLFRK
jgi:hypothetical protein